jgi:hypothetical protein
MVPLYTIMGRLRLFAPANVVARADRYGTARRDLRSAECGFPQPGGQAAQQRVDILRAFSEACRGTWIDMCGATSRHETSAMVSAAGRG